MAEIAVLAGSALTAMHKGVSDRNLSYDEAQGIREASMRKAAAATAEVGEGKRLKERMESRAIALAAFQGGGVDDPSITQLIGDINAEGEYRVLSRLYTGMGEAQGLQYASEQAMKSGDIALERGYLNAVTTVLSSYGSDIWGGAKAPKPKGGSVSSLGMMDYNPSSGAAMYA